MKRLPIAKTEIRAIAEGNFLYVDKTRYIKELVDDGHTYYFLSRPRRFGKSLFLDTLRAAFAGEKEWFKGLYLEDNWDWSIKYPVIWISFGAGTVFNTKELEDRISYLLKRNAEQYDVNISETFTPNAFNELIEILFKKFDLPVVILIDEYDKPILDNITKENVTEIREQLASFYSVLKDASPYLKFVFLTGVSRFSKTSIFSKLNNITDISLVNKYADICGISQPDLETVFVDYLKDVDLEKVKSWYDGYSFLGSQLYNPYDVLMFLWDKRYLCYWFETGTPTFLLELIKKRKFFLPSLEELKIPASQLGEFDIDNIQLDVLLFQTGYLTIKECNVIGDDYIYTLKMPNKEVRKGLNDYLLRSFYAGMLETYERTSISGKIYTSLAELKPENLKQIFVSLFAGISHQWFTKNRISEYEGFYCSMFYVFFAALGLEIKSEDNTNKGRIDFTVTTNSGIFIFEIKMKKIASNALQQIKERNYYEKYLSQNKEIFLIGIEFDEEVRNISTFECEKII